MWRRLVLEKGVSLDQSGNMTIDMIKGFSIPVAAHLYVFVCGLYGEDHSTRRTGL